MSEEKNEKELKILTKNKIDEKNKHDISIDDMWNAIEKFGIKHEILDPHNKLNYGAIHDLYLTIKNRNPSTKENNKN